MFRLSTELQRITIGYIFLVALIALRTFLSGSETLVFLLWNVFLALLAYSFSFLLVYTKKNSGLSLLFLFFWCIFFPNAPYVITDFIHVRSLARVTPFIDVAVIFYAAWFALFIGILSFSYVYGYIKKHYGVYTRRAFLFLLFLLTTLAIYLGRFKRWNSWDILLHPRDVVSDFLYIFDTVLYTKQEIVSSMVVASVMCMCIYLSRGLGERGK